MIDGQQSVPFYERSGFKGVAAAVGLIAAIFALVGVPKLWTVGDDVLSAEGGAYSNTEIVLDTSAAMGEEFEDGESRLDAAVSAIEQAGQRNDEGLALRTTSSSCEGEEDLLVDFGVDQSKEVRDAAEEQRPHGKANIVNAVIEALGDFRTDSDLRTGPPSTRRVLVFTTGQDECFEGDIAGKIGAELKQADVSAAFTLVALKASGEELQRLEGLQAALESANAYVETRTPDTSEELDEVVEDVKASSRKAVDEGAASKDDPEEPSTGTSESES
jgi:hypothetical protein